MLDMNKRDPKVSVLMSAYNESEDLLSESINSILNQNFHEFEFIIINDNPRNVNMNKTLRKFSKKDPRIKLIINKENIGLQNSLNKGLKYSTSKYIVRMDADDISREDRISKQYEMISNSNYDVVGSSYIRIDEQGNFLDTQNYNFKDSNEVINQLLFKNILAHPTIIMKKSTLLKAGGYRNIKYAEDYDLWLRLITQKAKFYVLNDHLLKYRVRNSSISNSNRIQQLVTSMYVQNLYIERGSSGEDSFSEKNHKDFLANTIRDSEKEGRRICIENRINRFIVSSTYRKFCFHRLKMHFFRKRQIKL